MVCKKNPADIRRHRLILREITVVRTSISFFEIIH